MTRKPDFAIQDEGTIVLLYARSRAAQQWVKDHIPHAARFGFARVIEHRYAPDILRGILSDGMTLGRATGDTWGMMR